MKGMNIMAKMNYPEWFYNQYRYLKGNKGKESFNDTKWIRFIDQYRRLNDLNSDLLRQQPFGVVGNKYGFDELLQLLGKSNYAFDDLHDSLVDTYKHSLTNLEGKMMVNTHAVIYHTRNTDSRNVAGDKSGEYFVIDAPFNQMHFGDRDEFIRQRLHKMHTTENGLYIDMKEMLTNEEITDILGFSIMITCNGYMCNDWKVAIDDKGFKFKVKWGYASDVDFIVYKLDTCFTFMMNVSASQLKTLQIPMKQIPKHIYEKHGKGRYKCIINIFDDKYKSSIVTAPNFGVLDNRGITFTNIQDKTLNMLNENNTKSATVTVYALKYMCEIPNLYPAINYYDLIEGSKVYTDKHDNVVDIDGHDIHAADIENDNRLEVCTPPICLDRNSNVTFKTIMQCLQLKDELMKLKDTMRGIYVHLKSHPMYKSLLVVQNSILKPLQKVLPILRKEYEIYVLGGMLTSLVPNSMIKDFSLFIENLEKTAIYTAEVCERAESGYDVDWNTITKYDTHWLSTYPSYVEKLYKPFLNDKLKTISEMKTLVSNFYPIELVSDNDKHFNRPVSEYCFITLRYNWNDKCWVFDAPEIKRFHGIENTFYIDNGIDGDEVYKFFVLYTDTDDPYETYVEPLNVDKIIDFDLFTDEVSKHMGYVCYWNAENTLMKLSSIVFGRYDSDSQIQTLSKILKRKLNTPELLWNDISDIEYEISAMMSFDYKTYNENTITAPFSINFLFYTLNMMVGNEDKLESYLMSSLVNHKYNNRYSDIDISEFVKQNKLFPVNFSSFCKSPSSIDTDISVLSPEYRANAYYGYPRYVSNDGTVSEMNYDYTFNVYDNNDIIYPLIRKNGYDDEYYLKYDSETLSDHGYVKYEYSNDVRLVTELTKYLTSVYSCINELQTDYDKPFIRNVSCDNMITNITHHISVIHNYIRSNQMSLPQSYQIAETIDTQLNPIIDNLNHLKSCYNIIYYTSYPSSTNIFRLTNELLSDLRRVFSLFGFDNYALRPVRSLYIHLKKINTKMNLYEFRQWLSNINYTLLVLLDKMLAKNENIDIPSNMFERYRVAFASYVQTLTVTDVFNDINDCIKSFTESSIYDNHILPIIRHCLNIINNYAFDLYAIKSINLKNVTMTIQTHPSFVMVSSNRNDVHFHIPGSSDSGICYMIFDPMVDKNGNQYTITSLRNICEYTFFDGDDLNDLNVEIKNAANQTIGTAKCDIKFVRVGNTADKTCNFDMLMNIIDTPFDIQNIHESFDIYQNHIINRKRAPMNYEMFIGNHFYPLDKTLEMITQPVQQLPGPVDRIYVSNQYLNRNAIDSYGGHTSYEMYFKPSQVIHLPIINNKMTSVGGKYAIGQRLYLYTKDLGFVFPVVVTSIDWSQSHGFVECIVDAYDSKWFKITDPLYVEKYLTETIECDIIDDNISNFIDEYNNPSYIEYPIIPNNNDNDNVSLPGDPIYVTTNASYVYTRLNYFFNRLVDNRFIDEYHKMYNMTYMGYGSTSTSSHTISLNMISHDYNQYTDPELFPVLRTEPNDHEVWNEEQRVFAQYKYQYEQTLNESYAIRDEIYVEMQICDDEDEYRKLVLMYENTLYDIEKYQSYIDRLEYMIKEPEKPSTWFNVHSYDAALVYMNNGRAKPFTSFISNISYGEITDKLDVFVYDWEHKEWLSPSSYTVTPVIVDNVKINNKESYATDNVLYRIDIEFNNDIDSSKLMIYFGYMKSDIYEDITINDTECYVRFKPILSTSLPINSFDLYNDIRIRKHFDGVENYKLDGFNNDESGISINESLYIKRIQRTGEYMYSPVLRMCDVTVTQSNTDYDYTDFNLYVRNPFPDTTSDITFKHPKYSSEIQSNIDSFIPNQHIKLICLHNNQKSSYDGNVSTIIFEGITSYDGLNQTVTITKSSTDLLDIDTYICTVLQDQSYKCTGGVIAVHVDYDFDRVIDSTGKWIRVPDKYSPYKELPDEFVLVPKTQLSDTTTIIHLHNQYILNIDDEINATNNHSINNPFEYYYDTENNTKLPLSDTRRNNIKERLTVDTNTDTHIKLIKSSYIGICRYSLNNIPENGIIDVTGYIPTPLSRKRYEFYVNGQNVTSFDNVRILSPTSFQLCGLRSLHNFELVELVDDTYESPTFKQSPVYVSIDGRTFSSYDKMLKSNANILTEDIKYVLNTENHNGLNDYVGDIINSPRNVDIETNILDGITDTNPSHEWDKLCNLPMINGVDVFHLTTRDIGLSEMDNDVIYSIFDKVWKKERLTNRDFPYTHYTDYNGQHITLNVIDATTIGMDNDEWICILITGDMNRYFSLYVSDKSNGRIDEEFHTLKIIPFIKTGMYVLIDRSTYKGNWLHSTHPGVTPINI